MRANPHAADLALRDAVLRGDGAAAERLFQAHFESVHDFALYRLGCDREATEDVVQETFLVAVEKLASFDGRSSLSTWLCGIAKNKVRAYRRKRRALRMEDLLREADPEIDRILARIEREPLPDQVLEAAETRELVGATLSSLPAGYRRSLLEKYVEGLTVPQMAASSGRGVKAVESTLARARTAFARVFSLLAERRGGAR